jgi:hypothetical protein
VKQRKEAAVLIAGFNPVQSQQILLGKMKHGDENYVRALAEFVDEKS